MGRLLNTYLRRAPHAVGYNDKSPSSKTQIVTRPELQPVTLVSVIQTRL